MDINELARRYHAEGYISAVPIISDDEAAALAHQKELEELHRATAGSS